MQILTTPKLTERQLRHLSLEHHQLVQIKHTWQWQQCFIPEIKLMLELNRDWDQDDIYQRLGSEFIDWKLQESSDDADWNESIDEVATTYQLTRQQIEQFKRYINEDDEDLF